MSDEEHHFESKSDAGASKNYPQQEGTIPKNGYVAIKGRPCKEMEAMPSNYQAATLVALPSYPNSVVWSKENLVAIPSEHLITILNPASLSSARAVITLHQSKAFRIGLVEITDLLTPCLQPICLSKETRPCARSIAWSPLGLAPNSGCFLAVCLSDGHVKLYRAPYCEYNSEWIEVLDVSDLLFNHVASINYNEWNVLPLEIDRKVKACSSKQNRSNNRFADSSCSKSSRSRKRKGSTCSVEDMRADSLGEAALPKSYSRDEFTLEDNEANPENDNKNSINRSSNLPYITACQYASRSAVLSSLVVSWSPVMQSSETCCAILSVGAKSGAISFWRICEPQYFTIKHGNIPVNAMLIGLIQAHNSWITAICFGISATSSLESQLVLATGCSDGSVKIWSGNIEGFLLAADVKNDCFLPLAEVTTATFVPVSTIALVISSKSPERIVLAVGRGSGKLEVWIYDMLSKKLNIIADYNAHEQVVTGLAWAFDGCCLHSCSQDNSIRSWIFRGDSLYETPFSSKFPVSDTSNNFSRVSDLCFGLAVSPGELMIAVVRSFDANLQHQMYEKRSQRAVVEFFWTGDQSLELPNDKRLNGCRSETISCSFVPECACWETNILWLLKYYDNVNKPIVIWDTCTLLRELRKDFSSLVENILTKWISSWFSVPLDYSLEKILFHGWDKISMVSSRKLQLINIICRRVMLSEMDINLVKDDQPKFDRTDDKESYQNPWNVLLLQSERELQERIVAFSFQAVLYNKANYSQEVHAEGAFWFPVGVAQMQQWTVINNQMSYSQLNLLGSKIDELRGRNNNGISKYMEEESCSFCSASVPFMSLEVAWCEGTVNQNDIKEKHQLTRCLVSMRLCSVTEPLWFCMCCKRWAANLLPHSFFILENSPLNFTNDRTSFAVGERLRPLCPFCGILLQRSMPDFLLSTSPV